MSNMHARIKYILWHEPSWIAEAGTSYAMFMWGMFALLTHRVAITDWQGYIMPVICLCVAPIRILLLIMLNTVPRAMGAMFGCGLSGTIIIAQIHKIGISPGEGYIVSAMVVDFITVLKFSLAEIPELVEDIKTWARRFR